MKILGFLVVCVIAVAGLFGGLYYAYVTNTETPYQEIGITLNQYMPGPVRDWGCGRLEETFGQQLPPLGCQAEGDPQTWR